MGLFSAITDIFKAKSERKAASKQYQRERDLMFEQRKYARLLTAADRRYAEAQQKKDQAYARSLLLDDRAYARSLLLDDRAYLRGNLLDDRAYLAQQDLKQRLSYNKDRAMLQKMADDRAERSAASRGIDFIRLRDDAVKAGYNPMTALGMAQAYSTQVDYAVNGTPLPRFGSGGGVSSGGGTSGGGAAGGSAAVGSSVVGSHVPAGVSVGGSGYSATSSPVLAAGSFIADALDRGVDTYFNTPPARDNLADALRGALQSDQMAQQVRDASIPASFGYDLTEVEPFKPATTLGVPALRREQGAVMRPPMSPFNRADKDRFIPVRNPFGRVSQLDKTIARRLGIKAFDTVSAGDWAEIVGEVAGEAETTLGTYNVRGAAINEGLLGPRVPPSVSDYVRSGSTGKPLMRNPRPQSGWMDEFFQ